MADLRPILRAFDIAYILFLAVECGIRLYHYLRWDISIVDGHALTQSRPTFSSITLDEKLGWRATENYHFDGIKRNFDGTEYHATVSQDSNGFRLFGNVSSGKPRIFVIGDSFTQATDVSDDKTYYAVLDRVLDVEVFGYGVGGYGSLQEFLQFEKYLDLVKPNLIVWQYSTDDLINNSSALESESSINSNGMVRSYLKNDQIEYVLPRKLGFFFFSPCGIAAYVTWY